MLKVVPFCSTSNLCLDNPTTSNKAGLEWVSGMHTRPDLQVGCPHHNPPGSIWTQGRLQGVLGGPLPAMGAAALLPLSQLAWLPA